jgi:hypothetical protein
MEVPKFIMFRKHLLVKLHLENFYIPRISKYQEINGKLKLRIKIIHFLECIYSENTKQSKIIFSYVFKINAIIQNFIFSQEDIKVSVTLQLMNKIDPLGHKSGKFEYKYMINGNGYGLPNFISYQVNSSKFFKHYSQK